ncbi:acyl-CoA thioester hydrolase [Robiginitalea myxolifaciens]|uniref:Acyl-CoA thioester hydrolase n=1 Tax=Robiginitalea myxolifaciens TaxID=400055 RepID=A0A1I6GS25_9FLAO|nr:thioesterase family protein [Robiginitalea myxolifaciens]SFR44919.1 acyl-CoA thioester hydrolase [Robiginitalea myxolifaciens]
MNSHKISLRIRYGETDQMGVVYHGNYPQYLELGRVEWLRSLGISYKSMEDTGCILPVISLSINYKKPAVYDELITVTTKLVKIPTVRIEFEYEITDENQGLIATANTQLAFLDKSTRRPMRCPDYLMQKLQGV